MNEDNDECVRNKKAKKQPFFYLKLILLSFPILMIISEILKICQFILSLNNFLSVKYIFYLQSMIEILPWINFLYNFIYFVFERNYIL